MNYQAWKGAALIELTLVSRECCHLCYEMSNALLPLTAEFEVVVRELDVDSDSELVSRYDELVPVLLHGETELCHYHLDVAKVRDYLSEIR